jgi:hypothetical protein
MRAFSHKRAQTHDEALLHMGAQALQVSFGQPPLAMMKYFLVNIIISIIIIIYMTKVWSSNIGFVVSSRL